ncbi:MAG: hypothetical protein QOH63_1089 [Acidobacteriota bacterium]|jgi:hypothetical protein|nr:hypothetical protein [Acidobacteriota bacterium]
MGELLNDSCSKGDRHLNDITLALNVSSVNVRYSFRINSVRAE